MVPFAFRVRHGFGLFGLAAALACAVGSWGPFAAAAPLEVDEQLLTQPAELRKWYLESLARFNEKLEDACLRNKVERVVVDTGRDPAEVLVDSINARSLRIRGRSLSVDKALPGLCPLDRPQATPRVAWVDGLRILLGQTCSTVC